MTQLVNRRDTFYPHSPYREVDNTELYYVYFMDRVSVTRDLPTKINVVVLSSSRCRCPSRHPPYNVDPVGSVAVSIVSPLLRSREVWWREGLRRPFDVFIDRIQTQQGQPWPFKLKLRSKDVSEVIGLLNSDRYHWPGSYPGTVRVRVVVTEKLRYRKCQRKSRTIKYSRQVLDPGSVDYERVEVLR